ncbi:hypothetical protein GGS21DRAFT_351712 [Xylaria nigripes]|nr:hypothetical protein GGS21DRAFT_351712 [Xylaria nigripes]
MQLFATVMGIALVASGVSAQNAVVMNNCNSTIYVQSYPYDNSATGPLVSLDPGHSYNESFHTSGSTVKIDANMALTSPLFFGYSFSQDPNLAYYEFSTKWGNPFDSFHNILKANQGCALFDCAEGHDDCYSTPSDKKVYNCPQPVNLTATICA